MWPGGGMADATDLSSVILCGVRVQLPPRLPLYLFMASQLHFAYILLYESLTNSIGDI